MPPIFIVPYFGAVLSFKAAQTRWGIVQPVVVIGRIPSKLQQQKRKASQRGSLYR
jgi:hypothetical protein